MDFIEWRAEAGNLCSVRVPAAEQDVRRQLQQLREAFGASTYQDLLGKELTNLDLDRCKWEDVLESGLSSLKRRVAEFSQSAAGASGIREEFRDFKRRNKENFASLRSQELALTAFFETTDWDAHFEEMLAGSSSSLVPARSSSRPGKLAAQPQTKEEGELADLRAAIAALTAELDGENCTGVLTAEEHALFLRFHGNPRKLETALPQLTSQQIADHTSWWFGARMPKEQLKRRLLADWRERRDVQKLRSLDPGLNEERSFRSPSSSQQPRQQQQQQQPRRQQQVEQWREQKQREREEQQRRMQAEEDERRERERSERMQRQQEQHAVISRLTEEKHRIQREAEMARAEIEERERLERASLVRASAARIGERNKAIEEKRKTLIHAKLDRQRHRETLQLALAAKEADKLKPVASKLFAQTHAAVFREQTADEDLEREKFLDRFGRRRAESFGGQVLRVAGRAVPGWRKND